LENTGRPVISIVWQILCFGDGFSSPTMAGNEANKDRTVGAEGGGELGAQGPGSGFCFEERF
jgi:hypothetical protein